MFIRFRTSHHRLKVYIVENVRRDGRVVQETIAYLGSIDAGYLNGGDERLSIAARIAFWEAANPRLKTLANRLGDDAKRLRMAVHARIPWPMAPERARRALLEAEHEAEMWHRMYGSTSKIIEGHERIIAHSTEQKKVLSGQALNEIGLANKWQAKAAEIREQLKDG